MSASPEEVQTTCSTQEIAIAILQPLQDCLCAQYLTERYLARIFDETKIPIIESYINLALIKQETQKTKEKQHTQIIEIDGKSQTEMLDVHRLPSHEEIYAAKESMPLEQLFTAKEGEPAPRKLLILGRAGIGKTVLCQYLAVRWALAVQQPSIPDAAASSATIIPLPWLSNFETVFWLKLREIRIPDDGFKTSYSLAELIRAKCLSGPKKSSLKLKQLNSYLQENSEKILFILDGYDEIESIIGNGQYFIFETIFTELTQHRNVILTSRPTCSCKFTADRTLENMGFIDENISKYITEYMHGTEVHIENFISYLKSSPSIWGIAHIPVTLEMLCWLHKKGELNLTLQTLSELYKQAVTRLTATMADLRQGQGRKYPALQEPFISGTVPLTSTKDTTLKFLALLAYNAMLNNELSITPETIKKAAISTLKFYRFEQKDTELIAKLLLAGNNLGFIKTTNEGGTQLSDQTHYFIHLSFQDYFAAEYIAEAFLSGNQEVIDLIRQEKYQPRYQLMLWFVAGLLYLYGKQHTSDFTALNLFWQVLLDEPQDLFGLKQAELVTHCLDECLADEKVEIHKHLLEVLSNWLVYCLKEDNHRSFFYDRVFYRCKHMLVSEVISNLLLQDCDHQSRDAFSKIQDLYISSKVSQLSEESYQELLYIASNTDLKDWVRDRAIYILSNVSQWQEVACRGLLGLLTKSNEDVGATIQVLEILSKVSQYQEVACQRLLRIANDSHLEFWGGTHALGILSNVSQLSEDTCKMLLVIAKNILLEYEVRIKALDILSKVSQLSEDTCQGLLGIANDLHVDYSVKIRDLNILSKVSQLSKDTCLGLLDIANDHSVDARVKIVVIRILSKVSQLSEDTCQRLFGIANVPRLKYEVEIQALDILSKVSQLSKDTCGGLLGIANDPRLKYEVSIQALNVLSKVSQLSEDTCKGLLGIANSSFVDAGVRIQAIKILSTVSQLPKDTWEKLLDIANAPLVDARVRIHALYVLIKVSQYQEVACLGLLGIANDHSVDASVRGESVKFLFSGKNFTVWINEKTNVEALFSVCLMLVNPLVMTCNIFKAKDNFSINSQTLTLPLHKLREVIQTFKQLKEKLGIPCFSTTIARESMLTSLIEGNALKPKPKRNPLPYPSQGQITFDRLMQLRIKEEAWQLPRKSTGYTLKFFNQYGFPAVKIELVREATIDLTTVLAAALEESLKIPNIYYIDLSGNNLVNIALLINAIYGEHPNIPLNKFYGILVLSNNHITGHAFEELLIALAEHPCITTLLLDRNQIYFEPIFITRKVNSLSFLVERAGINLIDLTLNFIPKGFEFKEKDKIRIYYDRNAPILSEEKIKLKRVAIKTFFAASSYIHSRRCKESTPPMLIESLITIGKEAREKIITWEHGAVGLFVNKTNILNAHAYLMLEGISSFGQRYLIRGELFARRDGGVNIRVSLCTPEAFKYFTENTLQKTAILSREKIKKILIAMCSSRDVEDFIDYAALAKPSEKGCYSCVKWALNILAAGIPEQYIVDGLNPLAIASHRKKLKFW